MSKLINLTGKKYFRLLVVRRGINTEGNRVAWLCLCDCGKTCTIYAHSLRAGKTRSCGCLRNEISGNRLGAATRTHGEAHNKTPEYISWAAMRQRCLNSNNPSYKDYGGRGITICNNWDEYENFLADIGRRPTSLQSLERIKNDMGYSGENCKWALPVEQSNNKRNNRIITYKNETMTLAEWAKKMRMSSTRLCKRLASGWSIQDALFTSVRRCRKIG